MYIMSPIASRLEEICENWLVDLFGLPENTVGGFVGGSSTATLCGLAAGRNHLLSAMGYNAATQGLYGAPEIKVVLSEGAHSTIYKALSILGLGSERVIKVPMDSQGRKRHDGRFLKHIKFKLPVFFNGAETQELDWDNESTVESDAHPLFHSDRGFQYTNRTFQGMLTRAGMTQSMSRVARCIDNGPMEGFWGILKRERYYGVRFTDRKTLVAMIEEFMRYNNTERLQRNLGVLTPIEKHDMYLAALVRIVQGGAELSDPP